MSVFSGRFFPKGRISRPPRVVVVDAGASVVVAVDLEAEDMVGGASHRGVEGAVQDTVGAAVIIQVTTRGFDLETQIQVCTYRIHTMEFYPYSTAIVIIGLCVGIPSLI